MIQIFLSHNERDLAWCEWFVAEAEKLGIKPYLAEHDVQPGTYLVEKVEAAIDESQAVVVLVTDNSVTAQYVHQEIGYARKAKKLIIPVVQTGISGEELGMLQGLEYIRFDFESPHEGHAQLTAALRALAEKHATEHAALVAVEARRELEQTTKQQRDLVLAVAFACVVLVLLTLDS